jgi:hypothetical protein
MHLALPQLGSQRLAEILGLVDLPNFDFALFAGGVGAAFDPLDRLGLRLSIGEIDRSAILFSPREFNHPDAQTHKRRAFR